MTTTKKYRSAIPHNARPQAPDRVLVAVRMAVTIGLAVIFAAGSLAAQTRAELNARLAAQERQIESLRTALSTQGAKIEYLTQSDSAGLWSNPYVRQQIRAQIEDANEVFTVRTTTWIVALIAIGMGLIILLLIVRYGLSKRIRELEHRFALLRSAVDEDAVKREAQIAESRESQMHALNERRFSDPSMLEDPVNLYVNHNLPLRVADEIHRMRKRISFMDEDTTGLNALLHSLKRLEGELTDGGYEIVDLIGKKYVDGLNVEARFVPAENGSVPEETITDVMRPQVNYMGVMVQQAKVQVSKSYS